MLGGKNRRALKAETEVAEGDIRELLWDLVFYRNKAIEYCFLVVFLDPKNTSSTCPRRESRIEYFGRLGVCSRCGFIAGRDKIVATNMWLKVLKVYARVLGLLLRALAVKDETRQSGRTRHEGMEKVIKSI